MISYSNNSVLAELPHEEMKRLAPFLRHVVFIAGCCIYEPSNPISDLYFVTGGVISTVATLRDGTAVEVGTIGNEDVAGLPAILNRSDSTLKVVSLTQGSAFRAPVAVIRRAFQDESGLRAALLGNIHSQWTRAVQAAACNRFHGVEQRLSRCLLTVADAVGTAEFKLTHEFLALMLGAQRPSVSLGAMQLRSKGFIEYRRGAIRVVDRAGLEGLCCECYELISGARAKHRRLASAA
jgi:CRP-like cAMP-binding protein